MENVKVGDSLKLNVIPLSNNILKLYDVSFEYISLEGVNSVYSKQRAGLLIFGLVCFFISILIFLFTSFIAGRCKKGYYDNKLYDPLLNSISSQKVIIFNEFSVNK